MTIVEESGYAESALYGTVTSVNGFDKLGVDECNGGDTLNVFPVDTKDTCLVVLPPLYVGGVALANLNLTLRNADTAIIIGNAAPDSSYNPYSERGVCSYKSWAHELSIYDNMIGCEARGHSSACGLAYVYVHVSVSKKSIGTVTE